jgi:hypothetical protein
MKPKPFASSNHFTVPVRINTTSTKYFFCRATQDNPIFKDKFGGWGPTWASEVRDLHPRRKVRESITFRKQILCALAQG